MPLLQSNDARALRDDALARDSVLTVVTGIQRMIDQGKLVPGQRLLEAELTARFGVGRPAVREALRFLAGEGLVELIQNRGGRIATFGAERLGDMRTVFVAIFRAAVETFVARPISDEARIAIIAARNQVISAERHGSEFDRLQSTFTYFYVIAERCGNDFFREALDRLHIRHYGRQEGFEGCLPARDETILTYTAITERLLARDAAGVHELWKPSIERLEHHLRNLGR